MTSPDDIIKIIEFILSTDKIDSPKVPDIEKWEIGSYAGQKSLSGHRVHQWQGVNSIAADKICNHFLNSGIQINPYVGNPTSINHFYLFHK